MSLMLLEGTPEGAVLVYRGGKVMARPALDMIDDEKAQRAADEFNRRFEEGQPVSIQGVEFQKTENGLRIKDDDNVIGKGWASLDKVFNEWFDILEYNREGFERLE